MSDGLLVGHGGYDWKKKWENDERKRLSWAGMQRRRSGTLGWAAAKDELERRQTQPWVRSLVGPVVVVVMGGGVEPS